ncbi:MAG: hypothetical protein PHE83_17225 [Opitutaceae bacterium]|nr:hypothetical protein [Opitutaceae bacterium]
MNSFLGNRLLPYRIKALPEQIMDSPGQGLVMKQMYDLLVSMTTLQQPFDDVLRRRLAWHPDLLADLIDTNCLPPEEIHRIIRSPFHALELVARKPYQLPYFQELILGVPESAEQLCALRWKIGDNLGLEDSLFLQLLDAEPNRRQRLLAAIDEAACARDIATVDAQVAARKYESPAWALEWLSRNIPRPDEPLDPRLVEALSGDEGYVFLAARMLRNSVLDPVVWRGLLEKVVTPRWAYHCLAGGLAVRPFLDAQRARLEDLLLTDPGWLVEWLVDTRQPRGEVRRCYLLAAARAYDHDLIGDLHSWHYSLVLIPALSRLGTVAAAG